MGSSAFAFAGEADATEALAVGEHDAAIPVVPGVAFVLLHHRELHAIDGDQFIEGEAEGLGHQHIDLHQGLAAGVVGAQGAIALPGGGEVGEEILGEAGIIVLGPTLMAEGVVPPSTRSRDRRCTVSTTVACRANEAGRRPQRA